MPFEWAAVLHYGFFPACVQSPNLVPNTHLHTYTLTSWSPPPVANTVSFKKSTDNTGSLWLASGRLCHAISIVLTFMEKIARSRSRLNYWLEGAFSNYYCFLTAMYHNCAVSVTILHWYHNASATNKKGRINNPFDIWVPHQTQLPKWHQPTDCSRESCQEDCKWGSTFPACFVEDPNTFDCCCNYQYNRMRGPVKWYTWNLQDCAACRGLK